MTDKANTELHLCIQLSQITTGQRKIRLKYHESSFYAYRSSSPNLLLSICLYNPNSTESLFQDNAVLLNLGTQIRVNMKQYGTAGQLYRCMRKRKNIELWTLRFSNQGVGTWKWTYSMSCEAMHSHERNVTRYVRTQASGASAYTRGDDSVWECRGNLYWLFI